MRYLIRLLLFLGLVSGILYVGVFDVWSVATEDPAGGLSLAPTLRFGDIVLVRKQGNGGPGSLVRCTDPNNPEAFVVGRVFGVAGDRVRFSKGVNILVNELPILEGKSCPTATVTLVNPATGESTAQPCTFEVQTGFPYQRLGAPLGRRHYDAIEAPVADIAEGSAYLASDNRIMHYDSRDFGVVSRETCRPFAMRLAGVEGWLDVEHRLTLIY